MVQYSVDRELDDLAALVVLHHIQEYHQSLEDHELEPKGLGLY